MVSRQNMNRKTRVTLTVLATRIAITGVAVFLPGLPAAASIFGGKTISVSETPWQLLFEYAQDKKGCGAVWLGGRWAVTAFHCLANADLATAAVYAGISTRGEATPAVRIPIKRFIPHPESFALRHDITLLELSADVTATLARPIAYATRADSVAGLTNPGKLCRISGFGMNTTANILADSLHMLETTIVSHTDQSPFHHQIKIGGGSSPVLSACQGDSGGPIVVRDAAGTGWIVAGVTSTGTVPCGDANVFTSYTRISAYADWIKSVLDGATALRPPDPFPGSGKLSLQGGRIHLTGPRNLEILYRGVNGSTAGRYSGYFAAGDHTVLPSGLPSGAYLLSVRANQAEAWNGFHIVP